MGKGVKISYVSRRAKAYEYFLTNLNFKGEVFLEVLDDHNEERQLDAEGLWRVSRTRDERRTVNSIYKQPFRYYGSGTRQSK